MRKLFLVAACTALGLLNGEAWAKAVTLPTTKGAVKSQCGGKLSCGSVECGSTLCDYKCTKKDGKLSCTVIIYRKAPGRPGGPGSHWRGQ
jgi:hypothetical protein